MIPASVLVPVVVAVVVSSVVVVPVALSVVVAVVSVSVSGIPNSCCAKAKEGYCCPSIALDAKTPVAAIEKTAAARSNPFVKICFVGRDFINQ
jgi:hypothetical protein